MSKMEIIVSVEGSRAPKTVAFEDLFPIKDKITSIMFLWDANCYYVDRLDNKFIINGGRRIQFPDLGTTRIEYRRRNSIQVSATNGHEQRRDQVWLVGLRSVEHEDRVLLLEIAKTGVSWRWLNRL